MQATERSKRTLDPRSQIKEVVVTSFSRQEPLKSPFARMLIFLGIFFLFAMIKDIFGATESTKTIAKIQESTIGLISPKETLVQSYIPPSVALEEIEKTLT